MRSACTRDSSRCNRAVDVLSGGLETSVQDYPGRRIGMGIPRGGPMDPLAFRAANVLVKNDHGTEALEITLVGCRLIFHVPAVIAITGASTKVTVNGEEVGMWCSILVPAGAKVVIGTVKGTGFRAYLAVRGGFPEIPEYLGSKSTCIGLGGYQVRSTPAVHTEMLNGIDVGTQTERWRLARSGRMRTDRRRTTGRTAACASPCLPYRLGRLLPRGPAF